MGRWRRVLVVAGAMGVVIGALVAAFDWVTADVLFAHVHHLPVAWRVLAPAGGLLVVAASLAWVAAHASPATADEYIRNFHEPGPALPSRPVAGRLLASIATLGLGGAMGYEGPAIYLGAAIGSEIQRRLARLFSGEDTKVLLVAGAAAGVAAIFKAPATGVVFALEVPYQDDLARSMLLPAAMASAASYATFAAILGTTPLLQVKGSPPFDLRDLAGAAAVGLLAGGGARLFAWMIGHAKHLAGRGNPAVRALAAGTGLVALALAAKAATGQTLTLGAGYDTLRWAMDPSRAVAVVLVILALRVAATGVTVAGGGVGGLFIPLVIQGALLGRSVGGLFGAPRSTLFPIIGMAAFLGAGYRTPLAAVMFVAETTGRPGFVVPGLIAAVIAQLVMGQASVSSYQMLMRTTSADGNH